LTFINLPKVGSLTLDITNYLNRGGLIKGDSSKYNLSGLLYGKIVRSARRAGLSRRVARKIANRRRRIFVDNIIMHHKRLHDQNRKIVITNARERALMKKKQLESLKSNTLEKIKKEQESRASYQRFVERPNIQSKSREIRDRLALSKTRAKSRWASIIEAQRNVVEG